MYGSTKRRILFLAFVYCGQARTHTIELHTKVCKMLRLLACFEIVSFKHQQQKKQCLVKPKFASTPFKTLVDIFIKQASVQVKECLTKTLVINKSAVLWY